MDVELRPIRDDEVTAFRHTIARVFGGDSRADAEARFRATFDLDRTIAALHDGRIVGTAGAFTYDLTVPGGTLPMGGTTIVTVLPTHRRRGILRRMMRAHLDEVAARGEPLAGLWASESSIYGRFGYGLAAEKYEMSFDARTVEFPGAAPEGTVRYVEAADVEPLLRAVYERVRPTRPGMLSRSDAWWTHRVLSDPEEHRGGGSSKRYAICEGLSGPEGYAAFRQQEKWVEQFPQGELRAVEVLAATDDAHAALWRFLSRVDLFPHVSYWNLPLDDPLPWRVADPRRVRRSRADSLWLRVMDVPRALSGRAYAGEGRLALEVADPFLPANEGRYVLEAAGGAGACARDDGEPDLRLGIDALGALYLGGQRATVLARAGHVQGDAEALALADRLFTWPVQPWCQEIF